MALIHAFSATVHFSKEMGSSLLKLQILEGYLLTVTITVHTSLEQTIPVALNIKDGICYV
jgi:hypothetical protein